MIGTRNARFDIIGTMADESILIIRLSALGDIVLATGMMRTLRARHPKAHLAVMTRGAFADLCRAMGIFDEIIVDNRARWNLREWKRICKDVLADRAWNVIYDLQANHRTFHRYYPLARFLTRHPLQWARLTKQDYTAGFDVYATRAKRPYAFARPSCSHLEVASQAPDLSFCHGEGKNFNLLPERYILLIPGCSAGHPYKKWPPDLYRELSRRCGARGLKSVVMGTRAEAAEIAAVCRDNPHAIDFMGKSALADIPDLARGAELVVGNDTGPSHMARIAGAKTVTLFCRITEKSAREAPNAVNLIKDRIADITVDEVMSAADMV